MVVFKSLTLSLIKQGPFHNHGPCRRADGVSEEFVFLLAARTILRRFYHLWQRRVNQFPAEGVYGRNQ